MILTIRIIIVYYYYEFYDLYSCCVMIFTFIISIANLFIRAARRVRSAVPAQVAQLHATAQLGALQQQCALATRRRRRARMLPRTHDGPHPRAHRTTHARMRKRRSCERSHTRTHVRAHTRARNGARAGTTHSLRRARRWRRWRRGEARRLWTRSYTALLVVRRALLV